MNKKIVLLLTLFILTACNNSFEEKHEIAFLIESHCESEVRSFLKEIESHDIFRTKIVQTPENHSLFDTIKYVGFIKTSSESVNLQSYVNGAKKNCGSSKTGFFSNDGPVKLEPYIYDLSTSENKAIYIEVNGNNAKVYQ
jgi:hypothetical protein